MSSARWSGWSSLNTDQVLKAAFIACVWAGVQHGVVIQRSKLPDDWVDHDWTMNIMWLICFDAWWWSILSTQGRAAGYQRLSISGCWPLVIFNARQCKKSWAVAGCFSMEHEAELILNILICLLMSESVRGRPSFIHVDAWTGVWPGRSLTKAGAYVADYIIWVLHVQSAGCGL